MVKKIKFTISSEGEVSVNVENALGAECDALTAPFEESLGTIQQKTYLDSYYCESAQEETSLNRGETS